MDTTTLKESAPQRPALDSAALAARRGRQWSLRVVAVRQLTPSPA